MKNNTKVAAEIRKNRIKQANKFIKIHRTGSKVWRMMSLIDAMTKMKNAKFWLYNKSASIIELLDIMKISKMKEYDKLTMECKYVINKINLLLGETTVSADVDKIDSVITSGGIIKRKIKKKK